MLLINRDVSYKLCIQALIRTSSASMRRQQNKRRAKAAAKDLMDLLCKTAFLLPERVPEREQNPDGPRPWARFVPTHLFTAITPNCWEHEMPK